jgi:hypothetical protein
MEVDPGRVKTNLVFARTVRKDLAAAELVSRLDGLGVRVIALEKDKIQAVTHYQGEGRHIDAAAQACTIFVHMEDAQYCLQQCLE